MNNITTFSKIAINSAFTPAPHTVGSGRVYIKRENGICPQVGTSEEGIFYPTDRVIPSNIPPRILKRYV